MTREKKFTQRLKELIGQPVNKVVDRNRDRLYTLHDKRDDLYKKYILPLDNQITPLKDSIVIDCEHPTKHIIVTAEPWDEDDGEGNSWNGTNFKVLCQSCDRTWTIHGRGQDGSLRFHEGDESYGSHLRVPLYEIQDIWNELITEENKQSAKLHAKIQEEEERKLYKKLKEKYE